MQNPELTTEQKSKLHAWIKENCNDYKCQFCKSSHVLIGHEFVEVLHLGGCRNPDPNIYPLVPLICSRCGATNFLSAVHIGLVEPFNGAPDPELGEKGAASGN